MLRILQGDAREKLAELPDQSVHCCVTSPPYWGLRDYGTGSWSGGDDGCKHVVGEMRRGLGLADSVANVRGGGKKIATCPDIQARHVCPKCGATRVDRQIGLERTPDEYVASLVAVFREVRRVLRDDGTLWLNLGDCYATGAGKVGDCPGGGKQGARWNEHHMPQTPDKKNPNAAVPMTQPNRMPLPGLKPKDLVGIPWRVAFALQADGWWLRQDIIWHKPQVMPESVTDRCTKAHEYIFLMAKSERYHYDHKAIMEPCVSGPSDVRTMVEQRDRLGGKTLICDDELAKANAGTNIGRKRGVGGTPLPDAYKGSMPGRHGGPGQDRRSDQPREPLLGRNKRSVWSVATASFDGDHFATFPPDLIQPCILAGCPQGGVVLDPFAGSGTTGMVALELGRRAVLIELNPKYVRFIDKRCTTTMGLPL